MKTGNYQYASCYRQISGVDKIRIRSPAITRSSTDSASDGASAGEKQLKLVGIGRGRARRAQRSANLIESFRHAIRGLRVAFQSERNLRIHVCLTVVVVIAALLMHVDIIGWSMLTIAIGLVITAELLNTALERLVDLATNNEFHRIARDAKDTAAAAVLCASVIAVCVGACVFVPRILTLLHW